MSRFATYWKINHGTLRERNGSTSSPSANRTMWFELHLLLDMYLIIVYWASKYAPNYHGIRCRSNRKNVTKVLVKVLSIASQKFGTSKISVSRNRLVFTRNSFAKLESGSLRDYRMFPVTIQTEVASETRWSWARILEQRQSLPFLFRSEGLQSYPSVSGGVTQPYFSCVFTRLLKDSSAERLLNSLLIFGFLATRPWKLCLRNKIASSVCVCVCNCLSNKFLYTYARNYLAKLARKIINM